MTTLWINDFSIIFNKMSEIYPDKDFDVNRMVNAIVRFCIICIIVLVLTHQANKNIVGILIITIILSTLYAMEQSTKTITLDTKVEVSTKDKDSHPLQQKVDSQEWYTGNDGIKYWKAFPNVPYTKSIFNNMNATLAQRLKAVGLENAYPLESNNPDFYKYLYEVDMGMKKNKSTAAKGEIGTFDPEETFMNVNDTSMLFSQINESDIAFQK